MGSSKSNDSIELPDSPQPSQLPLVVEQTVLPGSFTVKGDLIADERTLIEGQVKGDVLVPDHQVRIGRTGRVVGEVFAKIIIVEGKVNGNLSAQEDLTLRPSAQVHGNLVAAQVRLEDGCSFRGTVDMDTMARTAAISEARKKTLALLPGAGRRTGQD